MLKLNASTFLSLFFLLLWHCGICQTKDSTLQYDIAVSFGSSCCGVPNAAPLQKAIVKFKKQQHIKKIRAERISPMGKEGEYIMGFKLQSLKPSQRKKMKRIIQSVAAKLKDKGYATTTENYIIELKQLPPQATIKKIYF